MAGGVIGFSAEDKLEISGSVYAATRTVQDSNGDQHTGASTTGIQGKLRIGDFRDGRASWGVHVAHMTAERDRGDTQNESLSALDVAVPVLEHLPTLRGHLPGIILSRG